MLVLGDSMREIVPTNSQCLSTLGEGIYGTLNGEYVAFPSTKTVVDDTYLLEERQCEVVGDMVVCLPLQPSLLAPCGYEYGESTIADGAICLSALGAGDNVRKSLEDVEIGGYLVLETNECFIKQGDAFVYAGQWVDGSLGTSAPFGTFPFFGNIFHANSPYGVGVYCATWWRYK